MGTHEILFDADLVDRVQVAGPDNAAFWQSVTDENLSDYGWAAGWADTWPDTITLREAADRMDFDLFAGDNEALVLTKTSVPVAELYEYSTVQLDANDAEDRTGRLHVGLRRCP